jgi:hypothetical protein
MPQGAGLKPRRTRCNRTRHSWAKSIATSAHPEVISFRVVVSPHGIRIRSSGKGYMSAWVIILAVCIGICLGFIDGILMLISPARHRRFVVWLNSGFRRSRLLPASRDVSRGLEFEYRLAGLGILVMCGWLAWELQGDVRDRLFNTPKHHVEATRPYSTVYFCSSREFPSAARVGCSLLIAKGGSPSIPFLSEPPFGL